MNDDVERLVRLETKLDVVLDHQAAFRASFEKHDERLKTLEQSKSHMVGFSAAIAAIMTMVVSGLKNLFHVN
jgi:hypothetical protein